MLVFTPLARGAVQGWAVTVLHMLCLGAATAFLFHQVWQPRRDWPRTPLDFPLAALLLLALVSWAFSLHRGISFRAVTLLINYLVVYYLCIDAIRSRRDLKKFVFLIIGMAVFLSAFGLSKSFGVNPFPWWHYPDLGDPGLRLTATYGNANHAAGYLEMALPLLLGLFWRAPRQQDLFLWLGLTLLLVTALLFTMSRGGLDRHPVGIDSHNPAAAPRQPVQRGLGTRASGGGHLRNPDHRGLEFQRGGTHHHLVRCRIRAQLYLPGGRLARHADHDLGSSFSGMRTGNLCGRVLRAISRPAI